MIPKWCPSGVGAQSDERVRVDSVNVHSCSAVSARDSRSLTQSQPTRNSVGDLLSERNGAGFLNGRQRRATRSGMSRGVFASTPIFGQLAVASGPVVRVVVVAAALMLAACATPPEDDPIAMADYEANNDPFEPLNRQVFEVNLFIDRIILKPAAQAYVWLFPVELRDAIHNIITNADEPVNDPETA